MMSGGTLSALFNFGLCEDLRSIHELGACLRGVEGRLTRPLRTEASEAGCLRLRGKADPPRDLPFSEVGLSYPRYIEISMTQALDHCHGSTSKDPTLADVGKSLIAWVLVVSPCPVDLESLLGIDSISPDRAIPSAFLWLSELHELPPTTSGLAYPPSAGGTVILPR